MSIPLTPRNADQVGIPGAPVLPIEVAAPPVHLKSKGTEELQRRIAVEDFAPHLLKREIEESVLEQDFESGAAQAAAVFVGGEIEGELSAAVDVVDRGQARDTDEVGRVGDL